MGRRGAGVRRWTLANGWTAAQLGWVCLLQGSQSHAAHHTHTRQIAVGKEKENPVSSALHRARSKLNYQH